MIYEQLLHILADDARTQLGLIQDATDGLLDSAGESPIRESLDRVHHGIRELSTLISDISDFYAHSAGRLSEAETDFDLRVTLDGVRTRFSRSRPQADWIALTKIRHDVPTLLRGRPARLQDILLGATSFVLGYRSPGSLRIEVSKGWERDDRVELVFSCVLCPQHPPSSEEARTFHRVFAPASPDGPLVRQHLRAELARRLAEALDGSLSGLTTDDSSLGFELRLPFRMRTVIAEADVPAPGPVLRGRRALVVDGNESRRERTEALTRLWGLQTEACASGRAALQALRQASTDGRAFDLALVDAELEDMPGMTLGRFIRLEPAAAETRLVLLFGVGLRGDGALADQSGYDAYLPRGLGVPELREALAILLRRREGTTKEAPILTRHSLADRQLEGVRVLLVGSEPLGALVLEAVLGRKGFRVERAGDYADAAERCERNRYGLVVMDLGHLSPGDLALASGLQALLREEGQTPVAALFESSGLEDAPDLDGFAPDALFPKPVDLELLCRFCEGLLFPHLAGAPPLPHGVASPPVSIISKLVQDENPISFEPLWLEEATMGIGPLKLSVIDSYLEEMPRRIERLSTAITCADLPTAEREVLGARAMALMLGAVATARCLATLAEQVQGQRLPEAHAMLTRVRAETERSLEQLRAARAKLLGALDEAA